MGLNFAVELTSRDRLTLQRSIAYTTDHTIDALNMSRSGLLQPITLGGDLALPNRVCMGSMTRNRCVQDNKPTQASVEHYRARAGDGVGLIVAEGTFVYLNGSEWPHAPLMYLEEHAEAWREVTDAVHQAGGKIFFQPWHPGRFGDQDIDDFEMPSFKTYILTRSHSTRRNASDQRQRLSGIRPFHNRSKGRQVPSSRRKAGTTSHGLIYHQGRLWRRLNSSAYRVTRPTSPRLMMPRKLYHSTVTPSPWPKGPDSTASNCCPKGAYSLCYHLDCDNCC